MAFVRRPQTLLVFIFLFALVSLLISGLYSISGTGTHHRLVDSLTSIASRRPRNAYVSLLTSTVAGPESPPERDSEDSYFIAARMLAYQLLHAPATRSTKPVPFVVLVTEDVPERKRERLRLDGATVVPVESVPFGLHWIEPLHSRYVNVMTKLRALSAMEEARYERFLFLDLDTVLLHPLDGVFDDEAAAPTRPTTKDRAVEGEAPLPDEYVYAGVHDRYGPEDRFNSGFFVAKPSRVLMDHYIGLMDQHLGRLDGGGPDQDMLNYAHRSDGPMPWSRLDPKWNVNFPRLEDWEGKTVHSIHEKWWNPRNPEEFEKPLLSLRWQMEGYFEARDMELGLKLENAAKSA